MNPGVVWDKYKALELWKRVLLIIPAVIAIALVAVYFFLRKDKTDIAGQMFETYAKQTDETIKTSQEEIDALLEEGETLEKEREKIKEELKENEKFADDIDARIDSADLDELERIRQDIARRVKLSS